MPQTDTPINRLYLGEVPPVPPGRKKKFGLFSAFNPYSLSKQKTLDSQPSVFYFRLK
jgi:hypothetical protein